MPLEAPGTLESDDAPGILEIPGTLEPGILEEPPSGSDEDGMRDEENGGRVPVEPPGNELLFGTVTMRLDDENGGRFELEDPIGTDIVTLLPGKEPMLLPDAGLTTELPDATGTEPDMLPPGVLPTLLEDPEYGIELAEAGATDTLLPGMLLTLKGGGTIVEPGDGLLLLGYTNPPELDTGPTGTLEAGGMEKGREDVLKLKYQLELGLEEYPVPVPQGYPVPVPVPQ